LEEIEALTFPGIAGDHPNGTPTPTPTPTSTPTPTPTDPPPTPTPKLQTFTDVPVDHWAFAYIDAIYQGGYVAGCSSDPLMYCPESTMTRAESAVFVERGIWGAGYLPPQPTQQIFADVLLTEWYAKWAEGLWSGGFTSGCGTAPLVYCPLMQHSIAEGTVFYLRISDSVWVDVTLGDDGFMTALVIEASSPDTFVVGAEIEFYGGVEEITPTLRLIGGRTVLVSIDTKIEDEIEVGDVVKVEAFVNAEGVLVADEIELAEDDDIDLDLNRDDDDDMDDHDSNDDEDDDPDDDEEDDRDEHDDDDGEDDHDEHDSDDD
jgi:hypothetical protein